jgi:hypothetical protein
MISSYDSFDRSVQFLFRISPAPKEKFQGGSIDVLGYKPLNRKYQNEVNIRILKIRVYILQLFIESDGCWCFSVSSYDILFWVILTPTLSIYGYSRHTYLYTLHLLHKSLELRTLRGL